MSIIDDMNAKFGQIEGVKFCSSTEEYPQYEESRPLMVVDNNQSRMVLALHGAHVMAFAPKGNHEILWLSRQSAMAEGMPIRGGIPLCMPWFGPHPDGLPLHGFGRLMLWTVEEVSTQEDNSTKIVLTLSDTSETRAMWPHEFLFRFEIEVSRLLKLTMSVTNKSTTKADFAFAYHTYFDVSEVARASIEGLVGAVCIDRLSDDTSSTQNGPVIVKGEIQSVFGDVEAVQRVKSPLGIWKVESDSKCGLAWNPGDKAADVADIGAGNQTGFLCYERIDALDWAPSLDAGATYTMTMSISSEVPATAAMPMSM